MFYLIFFAFIFIFSFLFNFKNNRYRLNNVIIVFSILFSTLFLYKPLALFLLPLFLFLLIFEAFIVIKYKDFNEGIFEAILNTNKEEFVEVLGGNWYFFIPAIVLIAVFDYLIYFKIDTNIKLSFILSIPFMIIVVSSQLRLIRIDRKLKKYAQTGSAFNVINSMDRLDKNVITSIRSKYPIFFGNLFYLLNYRGNNDINFNQDRVFPDFINDNPNINVKNIILVVGESANSDRFSTYGYSQFLTSPCIDSWENLSIIRNVHSLSNMTRTALPFLISYPEVNDFSKAYTCKNIFDLAKNKNINTCWIGNQAIDSLFTSSYGPIVKCANLVLSRDHTSTGISFNPKDDFDLLNAIECEFKQYGKEYSESNNLFVIHTVGSHAPYSIRSDDVDKIALKGACEYDLSIHHTDRFLDKIKNLADNILNDYVLIYTSDHGEVVEDEGGGLEHGLTFGGYQQYKVPFIILNNSCFDFNVEKYKKNTGNYANDMCSLLIAEAMGYEVDQKFISNYTSYDKILHSDYLVYDYMDLPQPVNKRKRAA